MDKKYVKYGDYYYLKDNKGLIDASKAYVRNSNGSYSLYNSKSKPYRLDDVVVTPKKEYGVKDALKDLALIKVNEALEHPVSKAAGYALDPSRHIGAGMQALYNYLYPDNNSGISFKDYYKDPYSHPGIVPGSGANEGLTAIASFAPVTLGIGNVGKVGNVANKTLGSLDNLDNKLKSRIFKYLSKKYGLHNTENLYRDFDVLQNNNDIITGNLGFHDPKLLNQYEYPVLLNQHEYSKLLEQPESIKLLNAGENPKLLGWATQEVMDKYKDPKAVASLYRRARAFANSRAFYKMPTKDMSASELSALARELVERDNTVVRGVSLNRKSIIETAINIDDPKIKGRLIKILNETRGKPFTKESISKEDYEFLADYVLTRVPLLKKPGAGRIDQYSNIKADPMFDSMYSTNSIHEALGYTYLEDKDGIKIIGKIDLTPSELKLESDPFILLDKGNLRKRINRGTKINYNIIKNADRSEGIGRVSITKGNRQIDDNYSIIREQEGKKTGQDHMRLRALRTGIDLLFTPKSFSYLDKSGEKVIKHIRPENKKTFEITSKGIKETEESQEFIKLIRQYIRSKNNRVKTNLLKKVNKKLENHKFIQYKYRTETMIEPIIVDAENGYMDIIEKTKKVKKPVIINDDLLVALQQEISDPNIARHYLINGRRGSKVAELKEILDWDELKNKFKKSKRNHENKINKSEGLTTAGVTGLGYYINKNNENNKK